jgi:hypothetical protein
VCRAANAVVPPAVASFDATGVHPRRLPLTPARMTTLLKGQGRISLQFVFLT